MIGRLLGDRYRILEQVGGGGMGSVFRAQCTFLERPVAVKILRPEFAGDDDFIRRFRREARAAASLSHPNIVSIYDVGQDDGVHYIVMEYVRGMTLKEKIRQQGALPVGTALGIVAEILDALDHAHRNGVVHRDVKPQNILLAENGRVKVADFGIARAAGGGTMEHTVGIIGTAHYFSPEQARGGYTGARSDIYSLGVVFYELVTGRLPFSGESPISVAIKHLEGDFPTPRQLVPDLPAELEAIILKSLRRDPEGRYQSAAEMLADLQAFRAGRFGDILAVTAAGDGDDQLETTRVVPIAAAFPGGDGAPGKVPNRAPGRSRADEAGRENPLPAAGEGARWVGRGMLSVIILAFLAFLAYGGWYAWNWLQVEEVKVPDVRNLHHIDAREQLEDAGLTVTIAEQPSDTVPMNQVVSQDPEPDEVRKRGAKVQLLVSTGPEWLEGGVPNVVGLLGRQAAIDLEKRGLKVSTVPGFNDEVEPGRVFEQNPHPGIPVKKGSTVEIKVSEGPEPQPVTLPDFTGLPLEQVVQKLRELGLEQGEITQKKGEYPLGRVLEQAPRPGETVATGSQVNLMASDGCINEKAVWINIRATAAATGLVRVEVMDERGSRVVYENEHRAGDRFPANICWVGEAARVRWSYDGRIMDSTVITP